MAGAQRKTAPEHVRIDQFLHAARAFKSRSDARDACAYYSLARCRHPRFVVPIRVQARLESIPITLPLEEIERVARP